MKQQTLQTFNGAQERLHHQPALDGERESESSSAEHESEVVATDHSARPAMEE